MALDKLKQVVKVLFGLLLLAGLVLGAWWLLRVGWSLLSGFDKRVLAALTTGVLVASGAIWVKHIEHRHSVEAGFRDAKVELFNEFMNALDKASDKRSTTQELIPAIREWKRRLLFWGGPEVMRGFLSLSNMAFDSKTVGGVARGVQVLGELILAMRKDVGLSNRGLVTGATTRVSKGTIMGARYMLRHPDLFLACLREDPSMPIERLTTLERSANEAKGLSA